MWKPDLCIYHGNCDDGFAAATVARRCWHELPCFGAMHNQPLPVDVAGKNVIMVDFSLKHDQMAMQLWKSCVVLDHHKTAAAELMPFQTDWITRYKPGEIGNIEGVHAHFDMTKSGAMLTWQFCFPEQSIPQFIEMIQRRDLWQLTSDVEQFSAAVRSYPQDFALWRTWIEEDPKSTERLIQEGRPLIRGHLQTMAKILKEKHMLQIGGSTVPAVNCPYHFASDAAHVLLEQGSVGVRFAAAYFRRADGRWQFSLRSDDGRQDVSEVAKRFGGGGHRNAAGFDVENLEDLVLPAGGPAR